MQSQPGLYPDRQISAGQRPDGLAEHAKTVRQLSDKLWAWMERVSDPLLHGPLPTPYYQEAVQDYHERFRRRQARP